MKIPTIEQIKFCDTYTIENEPLPSIELMERAATRCVNRIEELFPSDVSIGVFCGTGNNGGDGLAIARLLFDSCYPCEILVIESGNAYSADCEKNLHRLQKKYAKHIHIITKEEALPETMNYTLVVDALFGSGLNKPIEDELLKRVIERINQSAAFVFSVDVPSGLFVEKPMNPNAFAVEADMTLSFQFPKLGFFFPDTYKYTGEWEIADIGLHPRAIEQIQTKNYLIDDEIVRQIFVPRSKFAHKGDFGHGLLIGGSKGKFGAVVLSARSCLRSGIGLLTVHVPGMGYDIVQQSVPEALCAIDSEREVFSGILFRDLINYDAIAIGPGLGKNKHSAEGLKRLIGDFGGRIIFDADAINLLAENRTWLEFLPPDCIFTPHLKEFERLTSPADNSFERLSILREFSVRHRCTVVLKGAHTCISTPSGDCYFNTTGNPGMATGGSGDVLTGIILGLVSQGYTSIGAAIAGVFLHGLAGDIALKEHSEESLIPSDITDCLGRAFKEIKVHNGSIR